MAYKLPEPYLAASDANLTGTMFGINEPAYGGYAPPNRPQEAFNLNVNEHTPLLMNKQQRMMGPKEQLVQFSPLEHCRIARLSECSDDTLVGAFQDLVGLQDSRTFQIIDFERKTPLYFTRETANCCERNCFPGRCRPEHTEILQVTQDGTYYRIAKMDRSCCGGSLSVTDGNGRRIGSINNHLSCNKLLMSVVSTNTRSRWTVYTDRWGAARWIGKLPFGSCRSIQFKIIDSNNYPVAFIANEWTGLFREIFTDADDYFVEFGKITEYNERLLLLATAIFIDSLYFSGMCCNWTLRGLVLKKFNPVAKMGKVGKFGKYIPVVVKAATKN